MSQESAVHDGDRACKVARDAVIQLPLHLTAGQVVGHDGDLTVRDGQHTLSAQRVLSRAVRGAQKNAQSFYDPQVLSCAVATGFGNRRLIEGICKALEALLIATTCQKPGDDNGCRSLFSVCLRQIPNYVTEEQCLINNEDPENDLDVASQVYTDLEAFGSAPEGGWESLREVARAHGLSLIREAIQEGLIQFPLSRHILYLCLGLAAYDEAECVIEGMIAWLKSRRPPLKQSTVACPGPSHPVNTWASSQQSHAALSTEDISRVVGALRYYVSQSGRHGFMYRQMAVMLENSILPVYWMSSKAMIDCWNGVMRSITQQDDHAQSAALLLQVAISTSYKRGNPNAKGNLQVHELRLRACQATNSCPTLRSYKLGQKVLMAVESRPNRSGEADAQLDDKDNALQSTFSNILTVLSAINILRSPKFPLDSSHANLLSMAILRDMALEIRTALELANNVSNANRNWPLLAEPLHLPLLSAGLVSVVSRKADVEISRGEVIDLATLASLPFSKESVCSLGSFLCEVARCCDEANAGDGFRFVQVMVQTLITIATSDVYDKSTRSFCTGVAHAAAFAFSEDTGQAKHLDWALNIEGTIARTTDDSPKVVLDKTPARAVVRSKNGYKWEEGICEWIAKTPALALQRPTPMENVNHNDHQGEARKLRLVQALPLESGGIGCNAKWRLPRPKCRREKRGDFCNVGAMGNVNVKEECGNFKSSEELLFVRVPPRPQKIPRPQPRFKADMANDLDELSTPELAPEKADALREIRNPACGVIRKSLGQKNEHQVIGKYKLDMPAAKRRCLDMRTFSEDTDDELGLP